MICNTCRNENTRSKVYVMDSIYDLKQSQDRFFDEDGTWHVHDVNPTTTYYKCSNGHEWSEMKYAICWCER
jgi:hypothetical protein